MNEEHFHIIYRPKYYDVFERQLKKRKIFICEEITGEIGTIIISLLNEMDEISHDEISIYINSPGGSLEAFFGIHDMMQVIASPVRTVCIGEASSCAAMILASGSKGLRRAMPNSQIMIHQLQLSGSFGATGTEFEIEAKANKAYKKRMTEIIARHTNQYYRKIYRDCENDKYMDAEEAKKYGIIDEIIEFKKELPPLKMRNSTRKKKADNSV